MVQVEALELFASVVEMGSFSKAATRHYVTQSAVSQQIRSLEEHYGQRFLERSSRGVRLTPAGDVFYRGVRDILDRLGEMHRELQEMAQEVTGEIRVATVYSVGLHMLPPHIKRFLQSYPNTRVHLEYERTNTIYEHVRQGRVDIGIVAGPKAGRHLEVIPLLQEEMVLIMPPTHALAAAPTLHVQDLEARRFVAFAADIPTRHAIDNYLAAANVHVQVSIALDNVETIKRSVEAGLGIAFIPATCVTREEQSGTLAVRRLSGPPLTRVIGVIHRSGQVPSLALQRFLELLQHMDEEAGQE